MDAIPSWAWEWCRRELDASPARVVLATEAMSEVLGVELEDGRTVVLKARPADQHRRAAICVAVQRELADQGFPCARPLTEVSLAGERVVNAEDWRPGGEMMRDETEAAARRSAALLADLMARLERIAAEPPLPNPEWVLWDHDGPGLFPPNPLHDPRAAATTLPEVIPETARRARDRLHRSALSPALGHADWEAQNLRWQDGRPHVVYDWDSLAWLPEAAVVGAAAGAFASTEVPTLAPLESSEAFLDGYAQERGRAFTADELDVAWAASLWPALHNARGEVIYGVPPVALTALEAQADARLRLAGA